MVSFRKLTILQLGGEERLLKMDDVKVGFLPVLCHARRSQFTIEIDLIQKSDGTFRSGCTALEHIGKLFCVFIQVKLGSLPFCCLAPFSCTRLPLNQRTLFMVAQLIYQVPYSQFAILYITMR